MGKNFYLKFTSQLASGLVFQKKINFFKNVINFYFYFYSHFPERNYFFINEKNILKEFQ